MSVHVEMVTSDAVEFFRSAIVSHNGPDILGGDSAVIPPQLARTLCSALATTSALNSPSAAHKAVGLIEAEKKNDGAVKYGRCTFNRIPKERERPYHYQVLITFNDGDKSDVFIFQVRSNIANNPVVSARLDAEARKATARVIQPQTHAA